MLTPLAIGYANHLGHEGWANHILCLRFLAQLVDQGIQASVGPGVQHHRLASCNLRNR